jgi:hypothetical protein
MSYINIFGGTTIQPALISYLSISPFTANITLSWPSQFQDVNNVVANIIDINPTVGGLSITMPDASQTSVGQTIVFNNVGTQSVAIKNNLGGTITTIASGSIYYIYLIDNTTVSGTWRVVPFGLGPGSIVTSVAAVSATMPALTITGSPITSIGTFTFTLDTDLVALDSFAAGTGIAVRTGVGTWALRTLVAGSGVTLTNPDGVAGNPQIAVNANLVLTNLTVGNLNLTGNTLSSTAGPINIIPVAGQSVTLGSNATPITIDTNDNITNANAITAAQFNTSLLRISLNSIRTFLNNDILIEPNGTGNLFLGSNITPITIDTNDNITNVNVITATTYITGVLNITNNNITSVSNHGIVIAPNGVGSLLLGANVTPVTIDSANTITHVNIMNCQNLLAQSSIISTFYPSPIAQAWVYFNGATATINKGFNVTSVVRNSAGNYTINWSITLPDTHYLVDVSADFGATSIIPNVSTRNLTNTIILTYNVAAVATDANVSVAIFD